MAEAGTQFSGWFGIGFMLVGSALAVFALWLAAVIVRAPGATVLRSMIATGALGVLTVALTATLGRLTGTGQVVVGIGVLLAAIGIVRSIFQATLLQAVGIVALVVMMQAIFASLYYQAAIGPAVDESGSARFAAEEVMCYNPSILWP